MKNKQIMHLLLCGVMLYYAVPRLSIDTESLQGLFALSWLLLAVLVVGGNLSAFLYRPKIYSNVRSVKYQRKPQAARVRQRG